jgi:DNA helicase-2/ATP-dependent DNA helicase PcrA
LPEYESLTNPKPLSSVVDAWPLDPLGERHRAVVEQAAREVEANLSRSDDSTELIQDFQLDNARAELIAEVDLLVREQIDAETRVHEVELPVRIPASRFKDFVKDPKKMAQLYRRPLPTEPFKATMEGTLFHSWIEQRFGFISAQDQLDSSTFEQVVQEQELSSEALEVLRLNFEVSRWATRVPLEVESEIQVTIAQNTFICKLDAVFAAAEDPDLAGFEVEIVDWKTGVAPKTPEEIAERSLQLALYRMAYSRRTGIPEEKISVCLYYVSENLEIRPERVLTGDEIIQLWNETLLRATSQTV